MIAKEGVCTQSDFVKILICDDERPTRQLMADYCTRLCRELGVIADIKLFDDGDELLARFQNDADILLLDIEMPLLDGMSAARELRAMRSSICIVFITSFEQYAVPGYEVGAYRYLLKPVGYDQFSRSIADVVKKAREDKIGKLRVRTKGGFAALPLSRILTISTCGNHQVAIRLAQEVGAPPTREGEPAGETITAYESLSSLKRELPGTFFQCNESCIVNLEYVAQLHKNEVVLVDGCVVPVSKRRKTACKNAYFDCLSKLLFPSREAIASLVDASVDEGRREPREAPSQPAGNGKDGA